MRMTIIGGAGGMGSYFCNFFKKNDIDVRVVDKDEKTEERAKQLNIDFLNVDVLHESEEKIKEVVDADILLISVPIDITVSVIERVGPLMKGGSLLMDITSVKKQPMEAMERYTKEDVEVLGTHPLFGPTVKGIEGQTIIFVPLRKGPLYDAVNNIFKRNGAKIEFLDAKEHDEIMAVAQALPHFVLISLGITLKYLKIDVGASRKYMGTMYEILIDFVGRILHQDPHLYSMIQMNLEMDKIHEAFLSSAKKLCKLIADENREGFMNEIKAAREHFGNIETKKAMLNSDRLIEQKRKKSL